MSLEAENVNSRGPFSCAEPPAEVFRPCRITILAMEGSRKAVVVSVSRFPTLGAVKAAMALVRRRTLRLRTSRDRRYTALSLHTLRDVRTLNL